MSDPAVRATWSLRLLRAIHGLPPPVRDRALRDVPPAVLESLARAGRLKWIPIDHHAALLDGVRDALGAEYVGFYRQMVVGNLEDGVLQGLAAAGLRLFGVGPEAMMKMLPRAFALVLRDCGSFEFESRGAGQGTIVELHGLPPRLRTRDTYALTIQAVLEACYVIGRRAGTCELDASRLHEGVLRYPMKLSDD